MRGEEALFRAVKEARAEGHPIPGGRDWGVDLEEAYRNPSCYLSHFLS
jgi:hypothetical protein